MKKWYAGVGVLVVALGISLGTCSLTEAQLDEFRSDYYDVSEELEAKESELSDVQSELDDVVSELARLKTTKEMVFGKGLRLFDVQCDEYWNIEGKVQNVSNEPMTQVKIIVSFYFEDGTLLGIDYDTLSDLFPQEIAEWSASCPYYSYEKEVGSFDIYVFGNR